MSSPKNTTIKDIPDVPPEVFKAAKNGKLVIFIGAGVSRIVGCPSWSELAHKQLKDLYEKKALNYYEYTIGFILVVLLECRGRLFSKTFLH